MIPGFEKMDILHLGQCVNKRISVIILSHNFFGTASNIVVPTLNSISSRCLAVFMI
jgi:hypothetical protein